MSNYVVTAVSVRLHGGVLTLSKTQSAPRLHNLLALGGNRFEVAGPVEFKRGEQVGYDGELPKALCDLLATPEKAAARFKAAAAAKPKAASKAADA